MKDAREKQEDRFFRDLALLVGFWLFMLVLYLGALKEKDFMELKQKVIRYEQTILHDAGRIDGDY